MPQQAGNIFDDHLLRPEYGEPLAAPAGEPEWIAWFVVICLGILVAVRSVAYPRLVRIVQSTFSNQIFQQLEREEVNLFKSYALALNMLFVANVAFLIYKYNETRPVVLEGGVALDQFVFILGIVLAIALYRLIINRTIAVVTGSRKLINEYMVSSTLINQTSGLVLFPLVALLQFSSVGTPVLFWLGISVVCLSILLRWYRGLLMAAGEERLGIIEIFSYFCALEILPVLVLVKYAVENY